MMTRRRCSRFASAKVRLFYKLAKGCGSFFKKMKKKECRMDNKRTGEGGDTLLYNIQGGGTENGTDAGSESRSKIYFDYAEQQGGKDREAGLKRKTVRTYPLRFARPPILEGQRKWDTVNTVGTRHAVSDKRKRTEADTAVSPHLKPET